VVVTISKADYSKARAMAQEAGKKHSRALTLVKSGDYSGAVEASQHCVELAIKSLFVLFGLGPPKTHDPWKQLDKVIRELRTIIPFEDERIKQAYERLKYLSHLMERLHMEGMYGYNSALPSRLFQEKDAEYFSFCAFEVFFGSIITLTAIGYMSGCLSEEEKRGLEVLRFFFEHR